jgi:hypothetical protein
MVEEPSFARQLELGEITKFPIPEELLQTQEEKDREIIEFYHFIREQRDGFKNLNLHQVIAAIKIFMANLDDEASMPMHIWEGLFDNHRDRSDGTGKFRDTIEFTDYELISTPLPENGKWKGYLIRKKKSKQADCETSENDDEQVFTNGIDSTSALQAIQDMYEQFIVMLEGGEFMREDLTFPMPDSVAQEVQRMKRHTGKEVNKILNNRRVSDVNKEIARTVFDRNKEGLGVLVDHIAVRVRDVLGVDFTDKQIRTKFHLFLQKLEKSPTFNIELDSTNYPWDKRQQGYYFRKKERKPLRSVPLSPPIEEVPEDQKEILDRMLWYAELHALQNSRSFIVAIRALRDALKKDKAVGVDYMLYKESKTYKDSPLSARNYEDGMERYSVTLLEQFGIKVVEVDGVYQTLLAHKPEFYGKFLEEMDGWKLDQTDKNRLHRRVVNSIRHMGAAHDVKPIELFLRYALDKSLDGEFFETSKLQEYLSIQGYDMDFGTLLKWYEKLRKINEECPQLLGYNVVERGIHRYALKLTAEYKNAPVDYVAGISPYHVEVPEGTGFDMDKFLELTSDYRRLAVSRSRKEDSKYSFPYKILYLLAQHSSRGLAVSTLFLRKQLGDDFYLNSNLHSLKHIFRNHPEWGVTLCSLGTGVYYLKMEDFEGYDCELGPCLEQVPEEQVEILDRILWYAETHTRQHRLSNIVALRSFRDALERGGSVGLEYMLQKEQSTYEDSAVSLANYRRILPLFIPVLAEDFGISVLECDGLYQATLMHDPEFYSRFLEEMDGWKLEKSDETKLSKRITNSFRHMGAAHDLRPLKAAFRYLLSRSVEGRPTGISEICEYVGELGYQSSRSAIRDWFEKVDFLNDEYPQLLGYSLVETGVHRYVFTLSENYQRAPGNYVAGKSPYPIDIPGGPTLNMKIFEEVTAEYRELSKKKLKNKTSDFSYTYDVFHLIAVYSSQGKAISIPIIRKQLGSQVDVSHAITALNKILASRPHWGIILKKHEKEAYYLTMNYASDTSAFDELCDSSSDPFSIEPDREPLPNVDATKDLLEDIGQLSISDNSSYRLRLNGNRSVEYDDDGEPVLPKDLAHYRGLIDTEFKLVDRGASGAHYDIVGKRMNLNAEKDEVLVAIDGNLGRVTKISRNLIEPVSTVFETPFDNREFERWLNRN